jgi:predicted nucleotidyltransferase
MKKHSLSLAEREKTIEILSFYLLRQRKDITTAYLFGSFITSAAFSDIDLAVLTQIYLETPLTFELDLERELENICNYSIDVRVLNSAPLSFCQNVVREGRVIVDREPNFRSDFAGKTLKLYFDFARFRSRYLAEVVNAPV